MLEANAVTLCGRSLERPGHICAFFDSRDQEYETIVPYVAEGLEQGEQVITVVDVGMRREHVERLEAGGISVDDAIARDDLRILTAEDTYTAGGMFAVERMYGGLQQALADAKSKRRRVRTSGVMDWVERQVPGTERLMEYEARINFLVPTYDCTLLCVYDLAKIDGRMTMGALATHPYVIFGDAVHKSEQYVPPIQYLRQMLHAAGAPLPPQ